MLRTGCETISHNESPMLEIILSYYIVRTFFFPSHNCNLDITKYDKSHWSVWNSHKCNSNEQVLTEIHQYLFHQFGLEQKMEIQNKLSNTTCIFKTVSITLTKYIFISCIFKISRQLRKRKTTAGLTLRLLNTYETAKFLIADVVILIKTIYYLHFSFVTMSM